MDDEQRQHLNELLQIHQRRLRLLEQKKATFGLNTPPEIDIEIKDLQGNISHIQAQLIGSSDAPPKSVTRALVTISRGRGQWTWVATGSIILLLLIFVFWLRSHPEQLPLVGAAGSPTIAMLPTVVSTTNSSLEPTSASSSNAVINDALPRYPDCLIIGEWEGQNPQDQNDLKIEWDQAAGLFKGIFTKVGNASQQAGTLVGDSVYEATQTDQPGILSERSRWVTGANGVKSGIEWRPGTVNINSWPSSNQGVFYSGGLIIRRAGTAPVSECKPKN